MQRKIETINETLDSFDIGLKTYYLDKLANGRYAVSRDEKILKHFNGILGAKSMFISIKYKKGN